MPPGGIAVTVITFQGLKGGLLKFMLESIRKSTKSIYILLIFGAIILVFVFWGIGPMGGSSDRSAIAVVNGQSIALKDYVKLHRQMQDYYRNILKDRFTPEMEKQMDLKRRSIGILLDRTLAIEEADNLGIKVGKAEVQKAIGSMPAFQKDGVFDRDIYFNSLKAERLNAADFEEAVRKDLVAEKVQAFIVKDVKVTDGEVEKRFLRENRQINLDYVVIDGERFKGAVSVGEEEAENYLKENSTDFIEPARIKVFYVHADFNDFKKIVRVTEKDIKEFYDKNPDRFTAPASVRARHILVRPDPKNPDKGAAKAAALKKAEALLQRIREGEDFKRLAGKYSEDPGSGKKGGDLGWFPRGVMLKGFEEAAFSLKKGEVSGVVETVFGFHIIKVEEKRGPVKRLMREVRGVIVEALRSARSREEAYRAIKDLHKPLEEAKSVGELKKAAGRFRGVRSTVTGLLDRSEINGALKAPESLADNLFLMSEGEVSSPLKSSDGVHMVKIVERVDARLPQYKEAASRVKSVLREKKAMEKAKDEAHKLLQALKGGAGLRALAGKKKYKVRETGFFTMADGFIPGLGAPAAEYRDLFGLDSGDKLYNKVIARGGKFYLLEWKASRDADLKKLTDTGREELRARLLGQKQDDALNRWLDELRAKAKIQVFEDRM